MAKASLRKTENDGWVWLGIAVERARSLCGLSLKEFADAVGRDERQVARWITGAERTQADAIFAVLKLRRAFVIALAEQAGEGVHVSTEIRIDSERK